MSELISERIKVVFLEDSQNAIDGFFFRLQESKDIEILDTYGYWEDFQPYMHGNAANVDVAILDVQLPVSRGNQANYPIFSAIPELLNLNPNLTILVISAFGNRTLIDNILQVGATGYIFKNDRESMRKLDEVIKAVNNRDVYVPEMTRAVLRDQEAEAGKIDLTKRQLTALSIMYAHPELIQSALADKMGVNHSTYRNYLSQAYIRLGVENRHTAYLKLKELGIFLDPSEE